MSKPYNLLILFATTAVLGTFVCGCSRSERQALIEATMREARDNAGEMQLVLDGYRGGVCSGAAEYVVAAVYGQGTRTGHGMDSIEALYRELPRNNSWGFDSMQMVRGERYASIPTIFVKDVGTLTASYIRNNIDDAWRLRSDRLWNQGIPDEIFYEMLLPYRIGNEPLSDWRDAYRKSLSSLADTLKQCGSSVLAARIIAEEIGACPYNDRLSTPHRSALDLLEAPVGYCREDCDRTVYAMRSLGVPVAIDRMLVSPENGGSHSWVVVWDNIDHTTRMFDNKAYLPTRDSVHYDQRRKGKVYRSTFAPDFERIARYRDAADAPAILLNARLSDVTAEYFGHNNAEVAIWPETLVSGQNAVYLGVFAGDRFLPVDIATLKGDRAVFTDIEPDLIYMPVTGNGLPCGYPFMLRSDNGAVHSFIPDENGREPVTLTRKFPLRFLLKERMQSVVGVHVQSAPAAQGPWTDLEVIEATPSCIYHRISPDKPLTGRYLRLFKPTGNQALIGLFLACRDTLGLDRLPVSVVGDDAIREKYRRITLDNVSFGLEPGSEDCIVHIDSPDNVAAVFLVPPTDDNFVMPAQEYELLYFAGKEGWKSAGRKMSEEFSVGFEAPKGALLWLRNLTKGREEQIFIWRQGRQQFNIDLYRPLP